MAIFGAVGAYMLVQRERDSFERGALDRVRALMTAIDAELRASITPLEMLARSPTLDRDDLTEFRAEAERALDGRRGDWFNIVLSDPDTAQILLNLLVPPGAPPFTTPDPASVLETAKSGRPTIGSVVTGGVLNRPAVHCTGTRTARWQGQICALCSGGNSSDQQARRATGVSQHLGYCCDR